MQITSRQRVVVSVSYCANSAENALRTTRSFEYVIKHNHGLIFAFDAAAIVAGDRNTFTAELIIIYLHIFSMNHPCLLRQLLTFNYYRRHLRTADFNTFYSMRLPGLHEF